MAWNTQFQQTGPPKNAGHPFKSTLNPDAPAFVPKFTQQDAPYSILRGTPSTSTKTAPPNEESQISDLRSVLDKKRSSIVEHRTHSRDKKAKHKKHRSKERESHSRRHDRDRRKIESTSVDEEEDSTRRICQEDSDKRHKKREKFRQRAERIDSFSPVDHFIEKRRESACSVDETEVNVNKYKTKREKILCSGVERFDTRKTHKYKTKSSKSENEEERSDKDIQSNRQYDKKKTDRDYKKKREKFRSSKSDNEDKARELHKDNNKTNNWRSREETSSVTKELEVTRYAHQRIDAKTDNYNTKSSKSEEMGDKDMKKIWSKTKPDEENERRSKLIDPRMERERLGLDQKYTVTIPIISYGECCGFSYEDRDVSLAIQDKDFCTWFNKDHDAQSQKIIEEIEGDLFEQSSDYALAHCVGADLRMGAGIAVHFKRQFGHVPDLLDQRVEEGGVAILKEGGRYIYYLVTKSESSGKPTYFSLWRSLCRMREHVEVNEVKKLAMPKIGCGLDRLTWEVVKSMIEFVFGQTHIEIRVCTMDQDHDEDKTIKTKLIFEDFPITKIAAGTLLLYFTTTDLHQDNIILQMSKKHHFLPHLPQQSTLGEIIYYDDKQQNYGICGCVVREKNDKISFKAVQKCMQKIKKINKGFGCDKFDYVAFQWVDDGSDDLINQKIITVLLGCLRDVDVYVCKGDFD